MRCVRDTKMGDYKDATIITVSSVCSYFFFDVLGVKVLTRIEKAYTTNS